MKKESFNDLLTLVKVVKKSELFSETKLQKIEDKLRYLINFKTEMNNLGLTKKVKFSPNKTIKDVSLINGEVYDAIGLLDREDGFIRIMEEDESYLYPEEWFVEID